MDDQNSVIESFQKAGQGQVFRFWEELNEEEQKDLLRQASEIDLDEIARLTSSLLNEGKASSLDISGLTPASYIPLVESGGNPVEWEAAKMKGEEALKAGKVAAFTVAGGQGTRLGFSGPKGTFPVTPICEKPLFQVFAEKLRAVEIRYACTFPWFIMTSHANHEETEQFFRQNSFFGLQEEQVTFFRQGRMPAVDLEGKILLESRSSIAMSPDGHGGALRALLRSGAVDEMEKAGIEVVSYFQVDNPLVRCVDVSFVGFHLLAGSEMSSKMVPIAYAGEKVGHFCDQKGKLVVIEYSDMPDELAEQTDENGALRFVSGSIAIHLVSTAFIRRIGSGSSGLELPFHRADKKIPTVDCEGNPVKPESPNGVKFEMFVFDAIPFAENAIVMETERADDFSPVKNAEGVDSARTSREDQQRQFARWFAAVGSPLACDESGLPGISIEVSPLFGYDKDSFKASWQALDPKPEVLDGLVLEVIKD
jgi:UDP-N-acetylglucosamine/UDP-N-acetylgalactosamine diphosphorylase